MLGYAVMSSHLHLVTRAGVAPSADFIKPLHVGFARWLNRHQGRFGPVFAERHATIQCGYARVARLLAYGPDHSVGNRSAWRS